jgi:hypothetical protein
MKALLLDNALRLLDHVVSPRARGGERACTRPAARQRCDDRLPDSASILRAGRREEEGRFEREIARRTFEYSKFKDVTQFLLYDQVRETWNRYKRIGAGSQAWADSLRTKRRGFFIAGDR